MLTSVGIREIPGVFVNDDPSQGESGFFLAARRHGAMVWGIHSAGCVSLARGLLAGLGSEEP